MTSPVHPGLWRRTFVVDEANAAHAGNPTKLIMMTVRLSAKICLRSWGAGVGHEGSVEHGEIFALSLLVIALFYVGTRL